MFGEGTNEANPGSRFRLSEADVFIVYSTKDAYGDECIKELPPDLVLLIEVVPLPQPTLASLGFAQDRLRKVEPSRERPLRSDGFIDDEEGVVVSVKGTVEKIVFVPTRIDRARCAGYYGNLEEFVNNIICILCPTIVVACPDSTEAGVTATFNASISVGNQAPKLTYHWTVNAGTIVEGQGTDEIKVDTTNLAGKTIVATVEVGGIDPECSKTASCDTPIVPRKN